MHSLAELFEKYPHCNTPMFLQILREFILAEDVLTHIPERSSSYNDQRSATASISTILRSEPWKIDGDDLFGLTDDPTSMLVQIDDHVARSMYLQ